MRILQVFGIMNMGGAESRMMDVYRNINRQKYHFDFLTHSKEKQYFEEEIIKLGGSFYKLDFPNIRNIFKYINEVRKIIRNGNYDAVHAHTSFHSGVIMLCAWLEHIPVRITHARTTSSKQMGLKNKILYNIGKCLIKYFATNKIAISKSSGKFLFNNDKFEIIPNSIDISKYQNVNNDDIIKLRSEFHISDNSFIIGQIGRFESMKNHKWTVDWFTDFLKEKPDSVLILVGDGPLREETEKKCKTLGIDKKVIFTGIRKDIPKLLHLFNVLIFPSVFEGLGAVILEAQACGTFSVISDTIPKETDMGLNLIKRVSLKDTFEVWSKAVSETENSIMPEKKEIINKFNDKGFSINYTINKYCEIYKLLNK